MATFPDLNKGLNSNWATIFRLPHLHRVLGRDDGHAAVHWQLLPDPPAVRNPLAGRGNAQLPSVGDLVPAMHLRGPGHEGHHGQGLERGGQAVSPARVHLQPGLDRHLPHPQSRLLENPAAIKFDRKIGSF